MRRIGIVLGSSPGGGVFQYAQAVLDAVLGFPEDEFEIVAAYADPVWLPLLKGTRARKIKLDDSLKSRAINRAWHVARLSNDLWRKYSPSFDKNVARLVEQDCDLWVCPSNDRWSFRAPIPALGTVHDLMHIYEPSFPEAGSPQEIADRELHFSETCRWSRGVAVDSEVGKEQLCDNYDIMPDRVFVLPYIAPKYIYDSHKAGVTRFKYDLPQKYLFYPANFWLHKNHARLFEAMDILRSRHPDMRLVLVGSQHNGYAAATEKVAALGIADQVLFLGYVPDEDMYELYSRARALIMPSFFGPTNIPPLEAFVAGCPVATSRIYGIPDQVGDAALLFDPKSVDEIAQCMERLWTDDSLCDELARRGRRRADEWGPIQFRTRLQEIVDALIEAPESVEEAVVV